MARWEPGTPERLQKAALDLFATHGFDQTTTLDIATAAGVTERTFFRHFADKRDVLFHGQDAFVRMFLDAMSAAPSAAPPMAVVAAGVRAGGGMFDDARRPFSRARQKIIDAHPSLQERERHKLAGLADAMAAELRDRGVEPVVATLAAESGATVFGVTFGQWIARGERRSFDEIVTAVLAELGALTGG